MEKNTNCNRAEMSHHSSNEMDNNDILLAAMKEGFHDVNKLLDDLSSYYYSKQQQGQMFWNKYLVTNESTSIVTECELDSISAHFQNATNVESLQKEVARVRSIDEKIIPMTMLMQRVETYTFQMPSLEHVKETLIHYNIVASVHKMGSACHEIPYVDGGFQEWDFDDSEIDHTYLGSKDLRELKKTNIDAWQKLVSTLQFQNLKQQIYQIVSDLDLQMETQEISQLAERIICLIVSWNNCNLIKIMAMKSAQRLFNKNKSGKFSFNVIEEKNQKSTSVHIGSRPWRECHGFGVDLETIVR